MAVKAGDSKTVCELFTDRAAKSLIRGAAQLNAALEDKDCPAAYDAVKGLIPESDYDLADVEIDGDRATGTNPKAKDPSDRAVLFAREGGVWRIDEDPDDADSGAEDEELRARALAWPKQWCALEPGASRAALREALGEPTEKFPDQDQWQGFGLALTAFYDAKLTARQLDAGDSEIPCSASRKRGSP